MNLDRYSNPIFNQQDLFDALYQGHQFTAEHTPIVEQSESVKQLEEVLGFKFVPPVEAAFSQAEFDQVLQSDWFMPTEYKHLDIETWLYEQSPPWDPEHTRLTEELAEFKQRNMLDLLRWLKYFVDTCRAQNILWGVGRGSSVASYVLFLIGVHKVDPIKYNLDWREFLR